MTTIRAAEQLNAENPWPGLEAFEENARAFFRGRDRESESLLDNVLDAPVTVLYGRSGLGKTSLLRAGLFPLLRERNFLPIYVRFDLKPESLPVVQQILNTVRTSVCTEVADAVQPAEDESLWEYLHRSDFQLWNAQNYPLIPVIVLDQFEEIFTLGERVPELVRAFETDLGDLAENRIPSGLAARIATDDTLAARFQMRSRKYKLLISLREDFLPDLEGWRQLIPGLGRSRIRLQRLRVAEAFDAVYGPAGHMMTEELARRIVGIIAAEDIHRGRDTATPDSSSPDGPSQLDECDSEEVEPALLSLFCRELNEERKRLHKKVFDAHLVEEAKGDILSNYYTSCVGDLPPQVAKFIETELITEKGFRNSYARDDAVPSHLTDDELTRLIRLRLLRVEERYGAQWIELTHDVLTSVVREHRDRRCAEEEKAALTARAEQERQAAAQREAELEERQQAAEALAAREQAHAADLRRRSRILRRVLVVTAIIAVIAVFFAVAATYSRWEATKAKQESTKAKQERTALRLASEGQAMFAGLRPGGEVRALQELLASQRVASVAGPGVLFPAVFRRRDTLKIIPASDRVMSVAVSPDGRRIVAASPDGRLRLWAADTGQPLGAPLTGHTDRVNSVAFSPDGHRITSASDDKTVRIWDADTGQPIGGPLTGHTDWVNSVAFSPDGHRIASASEDATVRVWNADIGPLDGAPIPGGNGPVAFSPDGRYIVSGSTDNTVQLWEAGTGKPAAPTFTTSDRVKGLAFSPDGRQIRTVSADGMLQLWYADTRQSIGQPMALEKRLNLENVAFSPDGHRIASCCSSDGALHLWDADTLKPIRELKNNISRGAFAFSPDGHRIVVGYGGSVRLWNPDTGQPLGPPHTGHTGTVNSVAFSPDGHRIASGSRDKTVRIWDADTGQPIGGPLTGHTGTVNSVAFSPDGHLIVSGSADRTVQLWNADTGQPIGGPLTGHTTSVNSVAVSPDGHLILSADDHTLRLWPSPAAWPDALCAKLTQNMSRKQWRDWVPDISYTTQCDRLPIASDEDPSEQVELPFDGLSHPQAITLDTAGNVYIADTGNDRVVKLAAGATAMTQLPFTGLNGPDGVAVDRAGNVYVVDQNNRVLKLPPGSTSAVQLPFTGLNTPSDIAVDAPGNVYVVDQGNARVLKLAAGTTTPTTLPFADMRQPNTIAVDTTGNVYVTDRSNDRLLELPAGTTAPSELPCGGLDGAGGVAVDTAGNVYLASYNSNHVLKLPKGWPAPSALPFTGLNEPSAVAVDHKGNVYVTDAGSNRVIKLPPQS